jgi:hypothetical protein
MRESNTRVLKLKKIQTATMKRRSLKAKSIKAAPTKARSPRVCTVVISSTQPPCMASQPLPIGAGASRGAPLGSGRMRVEERDVIGNRLLGARRIDRIWCGCGRLRGRPNFKPAHAPCSIVDRGCEGAKVVRRSVLQFFSSQSACSCVQPVKATSPASVVGHVLITARLASPRRSPSSSGMSTPHGTASQAASTWRYS